MALLNCKSCDDLRQDAPHFMANGMTKTECNSLKNNTGLSPSSGNDSCTDLDNVNDCLIGNMAAEVDSYQVCDWKPFMKKFIPNVWTTIKGIICTICGLWKHVECLDKKVGLITFDPVVRAFRGGGTGAEVVVYASLTDDAEVGTLTVYMDAAESSTADQSVNGTYGSTPADRDYIAFLTWCADGQDLDGHQTSVQVSVRNNSQSVPYGNSRAQHYSVAGVNHLSMNQTGFCVLPKGGHLKIRAYCSSATSGSRFRIHQFSMVLIPIVDTDISC